MRDLSYIDLSDLAHRRNLKRLYDDCAINGTIDKLKECALLTQRQLDQVASEEIYFNESNEIKKKKLEEIKHETGVAIEEASFKQIKFQEAANELEKQNEALQQKEYTVGARHGLIDAQLRRLSHRTGFQVDVRGGAPLCMYRVVRKDGGLVECYFTFFVDYNDFNGKITRTYRIEECHPPLPPTLLTTLQELLSSRQLDLGEFFVIVRAHFVAIVNGPTHTHTHTHIQV
eukprot:GHVR01055227.1.p1 GENE.GHVR01055227.1~~GHVR01055227.1.p1  ORF type:complete len:230 (+),score=72.62 GHVR01055227.1:51-740(+)